MAQLALASVDQGHRAEFEGLTGIQLVLLALIRQVPFVPNQTLAAGIGYSEPRVSRLLAPLTERGLVVAVSCRAEPDHCPTRRADPAARCHRHRLNRITSEGEHLLDAWASQMSAERRRRWSELVRHSAAANGGEPTPPVGWSDA
jgi:hypothetical protein